MSICVKMSLQGDSWFEGDYWDLGEQIVPHQLDMDQLDMGMVLGI